ncbi:MAG: PQQ-binding-like beta-propeller repeat protein [Candidatus Thermoplasmatota archaeon]|nr:PQQ-binding-like beta-propeller repeat protein [Candidatus Thermoplasmatota archaeon]
MSNNEKLNIEKRNFYSFHDSEITGYDPVLSYEYSDFIDIESEEATTFKNVSKPLDDPMDSPWPMYCHDAQHTGRSPYSTADNPGIEKWRLKTEGWADGDVVIDDEGTIYIGSTSLYAVYPNGTLKWKYLTYYYIEGAPAISEDNIIYFGTVFGGDYLFAVYTMNGTLKWKFFVGDSIFSSPSIADDGTIYFGSWDGYLYAVYPDGTLKWKTGGNLAGTTPVIAQDGTIYVGNRYLSAIYPNNGTVKWSFDPGPKRTIRGSNPCISADGTIYFGTYDGGELIAVNPDGTLKWREYIGGDVASAPAIGEDGTVYIGSSLLNGGFLHAFGSLDPNAPSAPNINGQTSGKAGTSYEYTFKSTSPLCRDIYYYVDWGDDTITDWTGPYTSGQTLAVNHTWNIMGTYTIKARCKDTENLWGPWGTLAVTMPRNKVLDNSLFFKFLERFPILRKLLSFLSIYN